MSAGADYEAVVKVKLDRAREHLATLFEAARVNRVRLRKVGEGPGQVDFLIDMDEPPLGLGAVLGDLVHNLHSALDAWAWAAVNTRGTLPTARGAVSRIQYPIYETEELFDRAIDGRLPGVPADIIDTVRASAPFRTDADDNQGYNHPLMALYRMSINDKHRTMMPGLVTVAGTLEISGKRAAIDLPTASWHSAERVLANGAVLASTIGQIEVTAQVGTTLAFDAPVPGDAPLDIPHLAYMADRVRAILDDLVPLLSS